MNHRSTTKRATARPTALLCALLAANAWGQSAEPEPAATLQGVTVQSSTTPIEANISGFGELPLRELPLSATVIDSEALKASGARRLADLTRFDASVTDAYNSPGYWDYLSIRGFTLDNRFNYRREGLPISAETSIPLDNKERIEILKGTSGIQAGTSAPGGLVNYTVKRPTERELRQATLEVSGNGGVLGAVDLGGRFGNERVFGYRFNAAYETLRPRVHDLEGRRSLAALALDWRAGRDTVVDAELEWSHKRQPSQAGFSLLGNRLPSVPDPRLNLNNQPWSQPSMFGALTGTLRIEQALSADWRWSAQIGQQRLRTDDRLAYAFGCSAEDVYDRYCSDGSYDLYDFRSEHEQRRQTAGQVKLKGRAATGSVRHELAVGLLAARVRNRFEAQAYNYAGEGNVQGTAVTAPNAALGDPNTNRDERSLEFSLHDAIRWNAQWSSWLGVRHTRLDRGSVRTDGSRPTGYDAAVTTPWLALAYRLQGGPLVYASWGQGIESQITPNKSAYSNAGVALPVLSSKQWEAGAKGGDARLGWQLAWFRITRPMSNIDACERLYISPCEAKFDGEAVHQGLEGSVNTVRGPLRLDAGATWIAAKRRGSTVEPELNGQRPVNVPRWVLRGRASYAVAALPGLSVDGIVVHEGQRSVLPDASIELPSWTRVDAALRYAKRMGATSTQWTLGVENLANRRYWKESPTQFGHVYLFPGSPRTLRLALQVDL